MTKTTKMTTTTTTTTTMTTTTTTTLKKVTELVVPEISNVITLKSSRNDNTIQPSSSVSTTTIPETVYLETDDTDEIDDTYEIFLHPKSISDCYLQVWKSPKEEIMSESECIHHILNNMYIR